MELIHYFPTINDLYIEPGVEYPNLQNIYSLNVYKTKMVLSVPL